MTEKFHTLTRALYPQGVGGGLDPETESRAELRTKESEICRTWWGKAGGTASRTVAWLENAEGAGRRNAEGN